MSPSRPYQRPWVWLVIGVVVDGLRRIVGGEVLIVMEYGLLLTLIACVVSQAHRSGSHFLFAFALLSGVVAFGGAIYLVRLPEEYNGIGDVGLILVAYISLIAASWMSSPRLRHMGAATPRYEGPARMG